MKTQIVSARQVLIVWGIFIAIAILINGTIPFLLGRDMEAWTSSLVKDTLFNIVIYSGLYLVVPLTLVKGWKTVRQPAFLIPLIIAVLAMAVRSYLRPVSAIAVFVLAYLHYRYDLSDLGFRSRGWRGDAAMVILIALVIGSQRFFSSAPFSLNFATAFFAGLDRLFLNPASTTENLFYFGFLAERLAPKFGKLWTPLLIGLMYMLHEMTNPEYWYEGMFFPMVFVGVALFAWIYLWRQNVIALWLGDGLGRFIGKLF